MAVYNCYWPKPCMQKWSSWSNLILFSIISQR